jgi:hypothetical protein
MFQPSKGAHGGSVSDLSAVPGATKAAKELGAVITERWGKSLDTVIGAHPSSAMISLSCLPASLHNKICARCITRADCFPVRLIARNCSRSSSLNCTGYVCLRPMISSVP